MESAKNFNLMQALKENGIYVVLLVLLMIIVIKEPSFLSLTNFSNILTQSSVRVIIALGVAGIIITQGTDLSAGRQVGLAALIAATMLQALTNVNKVFPSLGEVPIPVVILLVCAVGALIGLVNGLIVAYLNVTPFITTLGTMIIVYGINSLYFDSVGASPVAGFDPRFSSFAQGFIRIGGFKLSYLTFYAAIASVFVWVLWNKTRFGKNIFAIGGNPEAAALSGINTRVMTVKIFTLMGGLAGIAAVIGAARQNSATNAMGNLDELYVIAAAVVGGTSLAGGVGTIYGAIIGALILTSLQTGMVLIGFGDGSYQRIVIGIALVLAVWLDIVYRKRIK